MLAPNATIYITDRGKKGLDRFYDTSRWKFQIVKTGHTLSTGKKTIVFFLNPQGGPCRAQNEIVQKLQKDRKTNFNVAYVSTMNPGDQKAFYEYGVRNLPQLVLVDGKGKIAQFFPPGIQSYEALANALDGTK